MRKRARLAGLLGMVALTGLALAGCGGSSAKSGAANGDTSASSTTAAGAAGKSIPHVPVAKGAPVTATIATNLGDIVVKLDTQNAPVAAGRFIDLAKAGFYDGLTFHRVVPGFVIQGGDPKGDGTGGSGTPPVQGETPQDGYKLGSLAAAKTMSDPPGTFDCQFFIISGPSGTQLPNDYARFGEVVKGMDVVKKIDALGTGDGPPSKPVTMQKVTVDGA